MISVYNKKELFASERQLYAFMAKNVIRLIMKIVKIARITLFTMYLPIFFSPSCVMTMTSFALFCVLDKIL